jgi:hypothetical protein
LTRSEYSAYYVLSIAVELAERHYYKEAVRAIQVAHYMVPGPDSTLINMISATWSHVMHMHYKIKYEDKYYLYPSFRATCPRSFQEQCG